MLLTIRSCPSISTTAKGSVTAETRYALGTTVLPVC
jgi:hypothetical protein